MLELHLDPVGGIAGDMFVAAILGLRPDLEEPLKVALSLCPLIADVTVSLLPHNDGVLAGHRFSVERHGHHDVHHHHSSGELHHHAGGHDHSHTDWALIRHELMTSPFDPSTVRHAIGIFTLLAEAEAKVHGMPVDAVRFHEVGAWDSIADIVAAGWLINALDAVRWTVGPIPLGSGHITGAHGRLPLPAPATARLLEGFATIDDGIAGERTTPTGAAILRYLCDRSGMPAAARRLAGSSYGFGTKRLPGISNCLRLLAFETAAPVFAEDDRVAVLECDIDDQTGEDLAHAVDHLRAHPHVLDVVQSPVFGKKGRMMTHLRILAVPAATDAVLALVFEETTTIGIRHTVASRTKLRREAATVTCENVPLRIKRVLRPCGPTVKVEADDVGHLRGQRKRASVRQRADSALTVKEK